MRTCYVCQANFVDSLTDCPACGAMQPAGPAAIAELQRLRGSIDNFDAALVHLLAERFKATKAVGALKAKHRMPPADKTREADQVKRLRKLAEESDLDPEFAEAFIKFIVSEVIRHHEKLQGKS